MLHNTASIYYMLGDEKLALQLYDESLKLSSVKTDARGRLAAYEALEVALLVIVEVFGRAHLRPP